MRRFTQMFLPLLAAMMLSACGGSGEAEVHSAADDEVESETPIADEVRKPIERAEAVQDIAATRKAEMDDALAEAEGVDDDDPR